MQNDQILLFLSNLKDDRNNLEKCVDFLYLLQLEKSSPLIQVITILKFEKPILYSLLKIRVSIRQRLKMLFELSMDYEEAKKSINKQLV